LITFQTRLLCKIDIDHWRAQDLIDENSLYFCGYVNGDWTYSIDDGCSLHVLGLTV